MNIGQAKAAEDGQGQAQSHAARRRSEPEARVCTRAATGVAGRGSGLGPVRAAGAGRPSTWLGPIRSDQDRDAE